MKILISTVVLTGLIITALNPPTLTQAQATPVHLHVADWRVTGGKVG